MKAQFDENHVYKTYLLSPLHIGDFDGLHARASNPDLFYASAVGTDGVIFRFGALGASWDEIENTLNDDAWEECNGLIEICSALYDAGYQAAHFDVDADLLPGAVWYLPEHGSTVTPLAYGAPVLSWHDLDDAQKAVAMNDCCVDADNADDYFTENDALFIYVPASDDNDAALYYMSDCLRMENGTEAAEYFHGYFSESAFSYVAVTLSDDSESAAVYHVKG